MTSDDFWSRVDRSAGPDACWPWRGYTDANGYGCLQRNRRAHRVALLLDGRPVPPGMVGRHLCNNKLCCNPAHLAVGTHADNAQDRSAAGRSTGRRLLTTKQATELRRFYRRGLATSTELARLFGVSAERVRHIGTDQCYRRG